MSIKIKTRLHNDLTAILSDLGIKNRKDFDKYLLKNKDDKLTFHDETSLGLDSEFRLFGVFDEKPFYGSIINVPKLEIKDTSKVIIKDCIFTGDLRISHVHYIEFDNVIIIGDLSLYISDRRSECVFYKVNCMGFHLQGEILGLLSFSQCKFFHLNIRDSKIKKFNTYHNRFQFFDFHDSKANLTNFYYNQINFKNLFIDYNEYKRKKLIIEKNKKYERAKKRNNLFDLSSISERESLNDEKKMHTCLFLRKKSNLSQSKKYFSKIMHLQNIISNGRKNIITLFFIKLTGSFFSPFRFLFIGMVVLFLFSIVYHLPFSKFCYLDRCYAGLNFLESLYFSGITFTTIGYGDISPLGWTRFIAVSEGVTGILITSSFIISLVRRYIDTPS